MNLTKFVIAKMLSKFSYPKYCLIVFLLLTQFSLSQPINDECVNAISLCPGTIYSGTNIGATVQNCTDCSDDFNFCYTPAGTVWYQIQTDGDGGDVSIDISNLVIENNPNAGTQMQACLIQTNTSCVGSDYVLASNCINNATTDFNISAVALSANTTYFLVIGGDNSTSALPAGANFDIEITGNGVDYSLPSLSISTDSLTVCDNIVVDFTSNTNCMASSSITWMVDGNVAAVSDQFSTSDLLDGQVVSAEISCGDVCPQITTSNSLTLNVISIDVDAGPDLYITSGEEVQLEGITSGTVVSWSPPTGLSNPLLLNPFASPDQTTIYSLTVTDGQCESSDDATVTVISGVLPYNILTPNGDGINDVWEIEQIERFPDCQVYVYNRWGQAVFESRGYTEGNRWDGSKNGKKLNADVYFYVIELNDDENNISKGTLTLIR